MKRPLHVLALMFLTTSLALVGCGDSESKGNGDGGVPTDDGGPSRDAGIGTIDTVTPIEVGKPDVPIVDAPALEVDNLRDTNRVDAPVIDAPAPHDTGAVEVGRTQDTNRVDSGTGVDSSGIDARQNDARRAG